MNDPIPSMLRELARLGEAPPLSDARRAALAADPDVGQPDDAAVFADEPPAVFVAAVQRKLRATEPSPSPRWAWGVGVAFAVALLAVSPKLLTAPVADGVVLKGSQAALRVYRATPGGPELLAPGTSVRAGDRLQLAHVDAGHAYGLLFSVDGRGQVSEHARWTETVAGEARLPDAWVLDDAPAFEAFHLVLSDRPFDVDDVLARARASGAVREAPPLGSEVVVVSVVLPRVGR